MFKVELQDGTTELIEADTVERVGDTWWFLRSDQHGGSGTSVIERLTVEEVVMIDPPPVDARVD